MESVTMADGKWRDMLRERSDSAIRAVLDILVHPHGVTIRHLEGWEEIDSHHQVWVVKWVMNQWVVSNGTLSGSMIIKELGSYTAIIRIEPSRSMNPMAEFYRRAEKRLKLFAELVRD